MYKIIHADEATGTITIQVSPIVITLPLDENNNVPAGEALSLLVYDCIPAYNENVTPKDPSVKIANWDQIESLVDAPKIGIPEIGIPQDSLGARDASGILKVGRDLDTF